MPKPIDLAVCWQVLHLIQRINIDLQQTVKRAQIFDPLELRLLDSIATRPERMMRDHADHLGVRSAPNVDQRFDRLELDGFIEPWKPQKHNRKSVFYRATPRGASVLKEMRAQAAAAIGGVIEGKEARELYALLRRALEPSKS